MLLSDRRHMISGRGFIGIAAQSLGMGRPVLPPHLAAMLPYVITKSWGGCWPVCGKNTPNTHLSGSTDAAPRS